MKKWSINSLCVALSLSCGLLGGDSVPDILTAVRNGDHTQVKKILAGGGNAGTADSGGTTALMHSVIESDVAMMHLLIDAGANVNGANQAGSTALMYAAVDLKKASLLLEKGADAAAKNKRGVTAMRVAVAGAGSTSVLKLLTAHGAKPDDSLMAPVADKGDLEAIEYLLSLGVSPGGAGSEAVYAAAGARCEACVRMLVERGAPVTGLRTGIMGVVGQTAKRGLPGMGQYLLDHGAGIDVTDREGFTPLIQAALSLEPPERRDRTVEWLLSRKVDPNATNTRGETAYEYAARIGATSTMELLVKGGAKPMPENFPRPSELGAGADPNGGSAEAAIRKVLPFIEKSGEAVFRNRGCVSCHNNSLPAMVVAMARGKGFSVDEEQAKKELGFAVATEKPFLEPMRLGATIGGATDTLGYTLMGMAAAGYPADALTDSHINYIAIQQLPNGSWHTTSYRPPSEYSPVSTTAVALRAIQIYPIPGRRAEFEQRVAQAKRFLLSYKVSSGEERAMILNALEWAGASKSERTPAVKALIAGQNSDGSWSQLPGIPGDAYATGESLYALHESGGVAVSDRVYQKGVRWLLRNQFADGSWFVPTRTAPIQPFFETGFPFGSHQFASDAGSSWATMALLFTLPDRK
jgi:ankyrin repeat protein